MLTIAMVMPCFCDNLYDPNSSSMKWKLFYELIKCRLWSLNIEFYAWWIACKKVMSSQYNWIMCKILQIFLPALL